MQIVPVLVVLSNSFSVNRWTTIAQVELLGRTLVYSIDHFGLLLPVKEYHNKLPGH
jgi:hypothetical protein